MNEPSIARDNPKHTAFAAISTVGVLLCLIVIPIVILFAGNWTGFLILLLVQTGNVALASVGAFTSRKENKATYLRILWMLSVALLIYCLGIMFPLMRL